jgi:streptomycin 6-kinase
MHIFVPAGLEKNARETGESGVRWLDSLPERVAELERAWGVRVGAAFDHTGAASWVAPVELDDGAHAILKVGMPHIEARYEADALRLLDGQGTVRLLRVSDDGFSLLLERCVPGTDLWSLNAEERDIVACEILPRLWRKPEASAPFLPLTRLVSRWSEEIPPMAASRGYNSGDVAAILGLGRDLAASQPRCALLHGDFHPGNVLAAQRELWLVIDPKPFLGEPAFDLAQWFYNRYFQVGESADSVAILREEMDTFAEKLNLDASRIAGWTVVKALGWDCGPEVVALFKKVAEAC